MKREFIYFKIFDKSWTDMGLTDDDLAELENIIIKNLEAGKIIRGTGGVRKIRFSMPVSNKGKSGGTRILYVDYYSREKTVMLNAYAKGEKDNITENERKQLKFIVENISKELNK